MNTLLGILTSLGVDDTFFMQLVLFMFILIFVWQVAFVPYFKAFQVREEKTTGSQEAAEDLTKNTERLERDYQYQARALNDEIRAKFDQQKSAANKEQEAIIAEARENAKNQAAQAREKIQSEYNRAREELFAETKTLGEAIANRLTQRELQ